MFIFAILLITTTTVATLRAIRSDGYGTLPAPRSHHADVAPRERLL